MTQNQINYWNLQELKRHNTVGENETNRHNVVTENETNRHNVVSEGIDLGNLQELQRHNRATEGLTGTDLSIKAYQAQEAARHNRASEGLTGTDLNIKAATLAETSRHNAQSEYAANLTAEGNYTRAMAEAALKDVERTWKGLLSNTQVQLTQAQRNYYTQQIQNLRTELVSSQYKRVTDTAQALGQDLRGIASLIGSFAK